MMALAWHQFRLERRMFWRNPTAAFFNFLLPLLLLALFGAVFAGRREDLDVIVPGIAGRERDVGDVHRARLQPHVPARAAACSSGCAARRCPRPPTWPASAASAVTNVVLQLAIVICAGHLVFGVAWPGDWVALAVFTAVGVVCFASLGVALSHAIPNSESAPAYVNAVFLPMLMIAGVFYDEQDAPGRAARHRRGAPAQAPRRRALGRDRARRGGRPTTPSRCSCWRCGPPPGSCSRSAASAGTARRD